MKNRRTVPGKTIPFSDLATNLEETLNECAASGEALVVRMPDDRLFAIQPPDATEDDTLVDDLIAENAGFRELVAKSKAGRRKSFAVEESA